jgi:hypothetical protein
VPEIAARPFLQLDGANMGGSSFRRGPLPRTVWFSVVFIPRGRSPSRGGSANPGGVHGVVVARI